MEIAPDIFTNSSPVWFGLITKWVVFSELIKKFEFVVRNWLGIATITNTQQMLRDFT